MNARCLRRELLERAIPILTAWIVRPRKTLRIRCEQAILRLRESLNNGQVPDQHNAFVEAYVLDLERFLDLLISFKPPTQHTDLEQVTEITARLRWRRHQPSFNFVKEQLRQAFKSAASTDQQVEIIERFLEQIYRLSLARTAYEVIRDSALSLPSFRNLSFQKPEHPAFDMPIRDEHTRYTSKLRRNLNNYRRYLGNVFASAQTSACREYDHRETVMHCEMQMMFVLELHSQLPSLATQPRSQPYSYIGCSKSSCLLCHEMISRMGYTTRGCHGKLYYQWVLWLRSQGETIARSPRLRNAVQGVLDELDHHIEKDTECQLRCQEADQRSELHPVSAAQSPCRSVHYHNRKDRQDRAEYKSHISPPDPDKKFEPMEYGPPTIMTIATSAITASASNTVADAHAQPRTLWWDFSTARFMQGAAQPPATSSHGESFPLSSRSHNHTLVPTQPARKASCSTVPRRTEASRTSGISSPVQSARRTRYGKEGPALRVQPKSRNTDR